VQSGRTVPKFCLYQYLQAKLIPLSQEISPKHWFPSYQAAERVTLTVSHSTRQWRSQVKCLYIRVILFAVLPA
jgi:hypothetical protein